MAKTDVQINVLLRDAPALRQPLLGLDPKIPYRMTSQTFKELEFRADGIFDCPEAAEAVIFEFQAQNATDSRTVYHRGEMERILYHILHPRKKVRLIIMFLFKKDDPRVEPWCNYADNLEDGWFQVLYLDEIIRALKERQPKHPAVLVFQPLFEKDKDILKRTANQSYQQLKTADLEEKQRKTMIQVFESWFSQRFSELDFKEVQKMLDLVPLEETGVYKDLMAQGEAKGLAIGKIEGIQGEINRVKETIQFVESSFADGFLPGDRYRPKMVQLQNDLAQLLSDLEALEKTRQTEQ